MPCHTVAFEQPFDKLRGSTYIILIRQNHPRRQPKPMMEAEADCARKEKLWIGHWMSNSIGRC
jgi:hypothetical protein